MTMTFVTDFANKPRTRQMQERLDRLYQFIVRFKSENDGNSPSIRQMSVELAAPHKRALSTSLIHYYLDWLEHDGKIEREFSDARAIRVIGGKWTPPNTCI